MVQGSAFFPGEGERFEIGHIALGIFRGEIADPEIWEDCRGEYWTPWIELFLPLINNRHGFFQHFPFEGALMNQPATTMKILRAIQGSYFQHLSEVNKIGGM